MRSRRPLVVLTAAVAVAAVPLLFLDGAEAQLVTVALILAIATLLHRARTLRL